MPVPDVVRENPMKALIGLFGDRLKDPAMCPMCGRFTDIRYVITHLNDKHEASRDYIANWLDTLGEFPIVETTANVVSKLKTDEEMEQDIFLSVLFDQAFNWGKVSIVKWNPRTLVIEVNVLALSVPVMEKVSCLQYTPPNLSANMSTVTFAGSFRRALTVSTFDPVFSFSSLPPAIIHASCNEIARGMPIVYGGIDANAIRKARQSFTELLYSIVLPAFEKLKADKTMLVS